MIKKKYYALEENEYFKQIDYSREEEYPNFLKIYDIFQKININHSHKKYDKFDNEAAKKRCCANHNYFIFLDSHYNYEIGQYFIYQENQNSEVFIIGIPYLFENKKCTDIRIWSKECLFMKMNKDEFINYFFESKKAKIDKSMLKYKEDYIEYLNEKGRFYLAQEEFIKYKL